MKRKNENPEITTAEIKRRRAIKRAISKGMRREEREFLKRLMRFKNGKINKR